MTTSFLLGYFFSFIAVAAYILYYFYESGGNWRLIVAGMISIGIAFSFFYIFLQIPVTALHLDDMTPRERFEVWEAAVSAKHYALATIAWIAGFLALVFLRDRKR